MYLVISVLCFVFRSVLKAKHEIRNIQFFGGDSEEETPVPIPNTEVKLFSADGTAREAVWESRTPPNLFNPESDPDSGFFFAETLRNVLCDIVPVIAH